MMNEEEQEESRYGDRSGCAAGPAMVSNSVHQQQHQQQQQQQQNLPPAASDTDTFATESNDEISGIVTVDLSSMGGPSASASGATISSVQQQQQQQSFSGAGKQDTSSAGIAYAAQPPLSSAGTAPSRVEMHRTSTTDMESMDSSGGDDLSAPLVPPPAVAPSTSTTTTTSVPPDIYSPSAAASRRPAAIASSRASMSTSALDQTNYARTSSSLDQTTQTCDQRRRLFIRRTAQSARQIWDRINPNMQLCLCQTATKQIEAESQFNESDSNWTNTPMGSVAQHYVQNAERSVDNVLAVEVYKQFLFDEDATRSKCEE